MDDEKLLMIFAACGILAACNDDKNDNNIHVSDSSTLNQTVWGDEMKGEKTVTFTTTGAWTSTVTDKTLTGNWESTQWLSIDPSHGSAAGEYTVNIITEQNYSGADRKAEISINCNGQTVIITVTQKGTTEEGSSPSTHNKYVERISYVTEHEGQSTDSRIITLEYDGDNRITKIWTTSTDYYANQYQITFDYSDNELSYTTLVSDDNDSINGTTTLSLDSNGYVISGMSTIGGQKEGEWTPTYTDGHLTKVTGIYNDGYGDGAYTKSLTWNSENLTYLKSESAENTHDATLSYTSILNNPLVNLDLNWLLTDAKVLWSVIEGSVEAHTLYLFAMGYYGERSKYMVSRTESDFDGEYSYDYTYKTDANGIISGAEVSIKETTDYNGGTTTTKYGTFRIEYK